MADADSTRPATLLEITLTDETLTRMRRALLEQAPPETLATLREALLIGLAAYGEFWHGGVYRLKETYGLPTRPARRIRFPALPMPCVSWSDSFPETEGHKATTGIFRGALGGKKRRFSTVNRNKVRPLTN